jgi:two-component system response regulator YesN
VAQHFGFNSSYLSRKFKQETGKSFVEFLIKCRIERAIGLAGIDKKMFCTATAVGIPDSNYFGRCFKKYTGISYSEYVSSHTLR